MSSGVSRTMAGAVNGTGEALDVRTVGFRPKMVLLINEDSDDKLVWTESMADAAGHKQVKAGGSSFITSDGVTPLSDGFRVGADADINADGEKLHWVAYE